MVKISVVICTYNRCGLLAGALSSLVGQDCPSEFFEVIVVDNGSTDETRQVFESFSGYPDFFYVYEGKQGLARARNTGYQKAAGEYIAYMDDDARADKTWLSSALRFIEQSKPEIFGGPVYPFYISAKPAWFKDEYEIRGRLRPAGPLKEGEYLCGSNIILAKNLLSQLGGFDIQLGMKPEKLGYGEETAFMIKAQKLFPDLKIYFFPDLKIYHLVPEYKMSLMWRIKSNFISGQQSNIIFQGSKPHTLFSRPIILLSLFKHIFLLFLFSTYGIIFRSRAKYPFFQNYFFEKLKGYFFYLGRDCQSLFSFKCK